MHVVGQVKHLAAQGLYPFYKILFKIAFYRQRNVENSSSELFLIFSLNLIFFPKTNHRLKPRGRDFFLKATTKTSRLTQGRQKGRQAFFKNRVASLTDATKDAKRSTDNHMLSTKRHQAFLNHAWRTMPGAQRHHMPEQSKHTLSIACLLYTSPSPRD